MDLKGYSTLLIFKQAFVILMYIKVLFRSKWDASKISILQHVKNMD